MIKTPRYIIREALFVPELDDCVDVIVYVYNNREERDQHMFELYSEHQPSNCTRYEGEEEDGQEVVSWLHSDGVVLTVWISEVLVPSERRLVIMNGVIKEVVR